MEKQLTRTDYMIMLFFIFMLVVAVGAFFYGMKLGTDRTDARYKAAQQAKEQVAKGVPAYDQTYLVSFYHTIYLPYREFEQKWFDDLSAIESHPNSTDPASSMKGLSKLADDRYAALEKQAMPESSPLLGQAQQNYMKSLKLFADATKSFQSKANGMPTAALLDAVSKDSFFTQAQIDALQAQKMYYDAMVKWHESIDPQVKGDSLLGNASLSAADWSTMALDMKDDYAAGLLESGKYYRPFTPQDLVYRIDETIRSGQAKKLNASTIGQIADILIGTDAVRAGDFLDGKAKLYKGETLPMLPFFSQE